MKPLPLESNRASVDSCASELLDVVPAIMRSIRTHMRQASVNDLSVPQFRALRYLSCRRDRSLSEVAEHVGLSLPSASKLIQLLLIRGYVRREIDRTDRRRTVLAPTAKGQRVVQKARNAAREFLAGMVCELEDNRRRSVMEAMHTLRDVFAPELVDRDVPDGPGNNKNH